MRDSFATMHAEHEAASTSAKYISESRALQPASKPDFFAKWQHKTYCVHKSPKENTGRFSCPMREVESIKGKVEIFLSECYNVKIARS